MSPVSSEPEPGPNDDPVIDWTVLRDAARSMLERAHAPYSGVRVGAAALIDDGRIVTGCNVENASYGLSLCAECTVATTAVATGGGRLVALAVVGNDGRYLAPCGRCRQVLYEFGGGGLLIETEQGSVTLDELLPGAFGPDSLSVARQGSRLAEPAPPAPPTPEGHPPHDR